MKKYDVTALGELLIDFTENGKSDQGHPLFEANPGGAPCNVLAMLAKLGNKTAFIGKVGNDFFGEQLRTAVTEVGIDSSFLRIDNVVHTTLALVHTYPDGDRDFSFYRNPGADMMLKETEIPENLINDSKIFHFGTLSMTHEGVRAATKKAIRIAEEAGDIISFDPNLRPPAPEKIPELMNTYLKEMQIQKESLTETLEQAARLHIQFEQIHPFQDGNGRVGRMILNQQFINQNLLPITIEPKGKYRQAFRQYEKNGDISLMMHVLCKSELGAIEKIGQLIKKRNQQ